jgi:hypothetical protein
MLSFFLVLSTCSDPVPRWPSSFSASFHESTWFGGVAQQSGGSVSYLFKNDSSAPVQVIRRARSQLNPICNDVRPDRATPCTHYMAGASRYLLWPEEQECCLHCTKGCGALLPSWPTAVPSLYTGLRDVRNATCHTWLVQSGTPDRIATEVGTGRLCELYDGGAGFTGDVSKLSHPSTGMRLAHLCEPAGTRKTNARTRAPARALCCSIRTPSRGPSIRPPIRKRQPPRNWRCPPRVRTRRAADTIHITSHTQYNITDTVSYGDS